MPIRAVRDQVLSLVRIPSVPLALEGLTQVLEDPASRIADVTEEVARDPELVARVTEIARGPFYACEGDEVGLERITIELGMRAIHNIVLRATVVDLFGDVVATDGFSLTGLWRHSILTAELAHTLATRCMDGIEMSPGDLYTCGILHDTGRAALLASCPEQYAPILDEARASAVPSSAIETERLGFDHAQASAVLAQSWRLPPLLQDVIEHHHRPTEPIEAALAGALLALSDEIAKQIAAGRDDVPKALLDHPGCERAGMSERELQDLLVQGRESYGGLHASYGEGSP